MTQGAMSKVRFDEIDVDPDANIRSPGWNTPCAATGLTALAEDIQQQGLLQPVIVQARKRDGETRYALVAGFRRMAAIALIRQADAAAFREVPVVLFKGNADDARFAQLRENVLRKDLNPIEVADALIGLEARGHKQEAMAARIGMSRSWVSRLLSVRRRCAESVLTALRLGQITLDVAHDIATQPEGKQTDLLAAYLVALASRGKKAAKKETKEQTDRPSCPSKAELDRVRLLAVDRAKDAAAGETDYWLGVKEALDWALGKTKKVETAADAWWRKVLAARTEGKLFVAPKIEGKEKA